jgi:Putative zinc-finger
MNPAGALFEKPPVQLLPVKEAAGVGQPFLSVSMERPLFVVPPDRAVTIMSCDKVKESLSFYIDGELTVSARAQCDEHLSTCPVCRANLAELRSISRGLRNFSRLAVPDELVASINRRLAIEASAQAREPNLPPLKRVSNWVRPRIMPYTIGAFASIILFVGMLTALRPHLRALHDAEVAKRISDGRFLLAVAAEDSVYFDITNPVSPAGLAAIRAPYGIESPSLNPRGALAALTFSPAHRHQGDDDMVVVADVFTDGRASLADVVQAPRDKRVLSEFQDALRENAAFVPASYDQRPATLRVVFVFQKVDVKEREF